MASGVLLPLQSKGRYARLFNRIRRLEARFEALSAKLEQGFAGVPQDEGLREIEEAIANARSEKS
ncbi:MAG TPA: hypothetical protein VFM78_06565 [Marinobacter sp.]|nr:hypothetical protein [Marinobacter sp.]